MCICITLNHIKRTHGVLLKKTHELWCTDDGTRWESSHFARLCVLSVSTARNVCIQMFALFVFQVSHIGDATTMGHGSRLPPTKHGPITTNVQNSSTITTTAMKRWDTNYNLDHHMLFDWLHSTVVFKSQNLCVCAISWNCNFSRYYSLLGLFK